MTVSLVRLEDRIVTALLVHELGLGPAPIVASRYRLLSVRGRGARGLVCRALDTRLDREVAVKLYADVDRARDAEVDAEARALARLDHPNVVRVYDVGRAPLVLGDESLEVSYLVMELVDGRSLRTFLGSPDRDHETMLRVLADVAAALEAAHARGLAHRDVKPENVMIDATGRVRVVDFGLSRYSSRESNPDDASAFSTSSGKVIGTVEYMAPEAREGHADARSDQFSFAMMAWECIAGVLPFDGRTASWRGTDAERFEGHDRVDPALRAVLERALAYEPGARHPSMAPLRNSLLPSRTFARVATSLAIVSATLVLGFFAFRPSAGEDRLDAGPPLPSASDAGVRPSDAGARVVDAGAVVPPSPASCAEATGRFELDTVVSQSRVRSVPDGNHAYFVLDVEPIEGCDVLVRLTKLGDDSTAGDAGPYFAAEDIRDDEARVRLRPTPHGVALEQRFGLASARRARRDYVFSLVFARRRVVGDFRYLTASGALGYRGEVRGGPRRSEVPIPLAVETLPCASRCRLACPDDLGVVASCIEACEHGEILPACAFDAGVSRIAPTVERSE